eukprot:10381141-Karenia_brevis.AAC.1
MADVHPVQPPTLRRNRRTPARAEASQRALKAQKCPKALPRVEVKPAPKAMGASAAKEVNSQRLQRHRR